MSQGPNRTHDVFLSYSSKDKTWADAACAVLESHRVRCWIAPRDITHGDEWQAAIIKGLNGSQILVLIFSGHANASEQVRREVELAGSRGMIILPVRIEDVRPEGAMEYSLSNRHWLDAFTPPVERQLDLLAQSVKTLLGNNPQKPGVIPLTEPPDKPESPRPRAFWLIGIAASLFGLVALAVIMIAIKTRNGETKPTVAGESSNHVDGSGKIVEHDPSKNDPANIANQAADSSGAKPPIPPPRPDRIPPAGPARLARRVGGDLWTVEGDQLIKEGPGPGSVKFGDPGWTDYDFTFEARKSAGPDALGASFRSSEEGNYYLFWLGINNNKTHDLLRGSTSGKSASVIRSIPGSIRPREWYKVKISLRGQRIRILLEDHVLFACAEDFSQKGNVSLRFYNSAGRFRNIKVASPDGTVLWEGPPELPKKP